MFVRIGRWCHDHRKVVVVLWIAAMFLGNGVAGAVGDGYRQDFSLNGFESTDGFTLVEERFDDGSGSPQSGQIVFRAEDGVDDPTVKAEMEALFAEVAGLDGVVAVQSPYAPGGQFQVSSQGAEPGTIAFATVNLPEDIDFTRASEIGAEIRERVPELEGLQVELGGFLFAEFEQPSAELFGLAFAVVILIVAFGSVLAMGLPVGVALFGIGLGGALIILVSNVMEVPDFAPFIGVMIGLGVGIDYALLIVTRHREQLHAGNSVRDSIAVAIDTAGRSVAFAGATVVISLLGMLLMGIGFLGGLGIAASLTVAVTVVASLTLLPALLGFAGDRIDRTRWRGLLAAGFVAVALVGAGLKVGPLIGLGMGLAVLTLLLGLFVPALKAEVRHRPAKDRRETLAYRWSRVIQHRPWPAAVGATALLVILALPVAGLRLGFSDESNFADDTTTKRAYDLIVEGFGKGSTGPVFLVAEVDDGAQVGALGAVT
jgi:putative drug exporter of the RND superfamily